MASEKPLYGRRCPEMATIPNEELLELSMQNQSRSVVQLIKALISAVGKEEAAKHLYKARFDYYYKLGRAAAEKLGNPKDLDSYINEWFLKSPSPMPAWIAPGYFVYRTSNKAVYRSSNYCFTGEALKKTADEDLKDFIADNYCIMDVAWAKGFNPDMKYELTKHFLRGDDCCEFTFEV